VILSLPLGTSQTSREDRLFTTKYILRHPVTQCEKLCKIFGPEMGVEEQNRVGQTEG
jgi:hypothetical protein